ncbi:hypothetical protein MRX96_047653 [Rhipicephalus microplus]
MQRYSVSGYSHELDCRPFHFAEPIPAVRICAVCGASVNGICECPLDGDKFLVKDAEWKIFPMKNLLRRKVKCWNEANGCDAVMTISDMLKHFDEECVHHTTRCPSCSALLLRTNLCAHRRSNCSTHALPNHAQPLEPWKDSVQEPMITALETTLGECVGELKAGIEQILQGHATHSEILDEVSHILNALRETVVQMSEKQEQEITVVKNTAFKEVKKGLVAQAEKFDKFSRSLDVLGADVKNTANATQQSLEKLEQSHAELRRRCTKDDNQLQRVSDIVSSFEGILNEALERATKAIVQKWETNAELFASPKVKEIGMWQKGIVPTKSRNAEFYWNHFVRLEDLEREGYIEADQLSLKYELLPSSK